MSPEGPGPTDASALDPTSPAATEPSTGSKQPISLPITRAMPKPLLIAFVVFGLALAASAIYLLVRPSTLQGVPVEARRPIPADGYSHDPVRVIPVPLPSVVPTLPAACDAFASTRIVASGDGVARVRAALIEVCSLVGSGVDPELLTAVDGLARATIRFAQFERTAIESTVDLTSQTVYLNLRFADRRAAIIDLVPVLLHEAYHLAPEGAPVNAVAELGARRAEAAACREFIARKDWPRSCRDAESLARLSDEAAIELLRAAGFE